MIERPCADNCEMNRLLQRQQRQTSAQASPRPSRSAGFTLIEILVVLVIIGVLAALIAPNVLDRAGEAKVTAARNNQGRAYAVALAGLGVKSIASGWSP